MRDPLMWSIPIGRYFGIAVRVHLFFLILAISMIGRAARYDHAADELLIQALLFASVLLHEFGHCFWARQVGGDASEILMWPLGGLASVEIPNTPRANFITTAGGPLVNVILCIAAGGALVVYQLVPPFNPFVAFTGWGWEPVLDSWSSGALQPAPLSAIPTVLALLFALNWFLLLFNVLVFAFPLDGGRLLQCMLWPRYGFRSATRFVCYAGFIFAIVFSIYALITIEGANAYGKLLLFCLALFILNICKLQLFLVESGELQDELVFGHDFSQGYTSLDRGEPAVKRPRRPGFFRRWLDRRAERKRRREEEQRVADERRLDELLEKVQQSGIQALTDEERRFMTRVSAKYRNRH